MENLIFSIFRKNYKSIFFLLLILISFEQIVLQKFISVTSEFAQTINTSGKQRMYAQELIKNIELFLVSEDQSKIKSASSIFETILEKNQLISNSKINEEKLKSDYQSINKIISSLKTDLTCLKSTCSKQRLLKLHILQKIDSYQREMDMVVHDYEMVLADKIQFLKKLELVFYFIKLISFGLIFFRIVVPAIDEVRRRLIELTRLKVQFEEIQALTKTGGWELDLETNATTWSKEIYRIYKLPYGKSPDKVDAVSFYASHERERLLEIIDQCRTKKIEYDEEFEFYDSEGNRKWVRAIGKPVIQSNGEVKKLIGSFQDITTKKEMEKTLIHSAKLVSIGQLAAGIGHEVNNPLAIVKGYISLAQKTHENMDKDLAEILVKIDRATDRIGNVVKGLTTFARIENDQSNSNVFNLKSLLYEIKNMIKEIYSKDGIELIFHMDELDEEIKIKGDRGKLEQVILNLINNSKDATEGQSKRKIEIDVDYNPNNRQVQLSVKDNGPGISSELRERIFDPFYTTKEVGKGTGIGLFLSYKLVTNDLAGNLSLGESESGALFLIELPCE